MLIQCCCGEGFYFYSYDGGWGRRVRGDRLLESTLEEFGSCNVCSINHQCAINMVMPGIDWPILQWQCQKIINSSISFLVLILSAGCRGCYSSHKSSVNDFDFDIHLMYSNDQYHCSIKIWPQHFRFVNQGKDCPLTGLYCTCIY